MGPERGALVVYMQMVRLVQNRSFWTNQLIMIVPSYVALFVTITAREEKKKIALIHRTQASVRPWIHALEGQHFL